MKLPGCRLLLVLALAGGAFPAAASAPNASANPYGLRAAGAFAAMQKFFYRKGSGLYAPRYPAPRAVSSELWPFSQAFAATISVAELHGTGRGQVGCRSLGAGGLETPEGVSAGESAVNRREIGLGRRRWDSAVRISRGGLPPPDRLLRSPARRDLIPADSTICRRAKRTNSAHWERPPPA
jgi:hypothetical protein